MTQHLHTRALGAITLTAALALGVAACGSDDSTSSSPSSASGTTTAGAPAADGGASTGSSTEHNDADVTFATEMLPHHAQALTMVEMTKNRPLDPKVQQLADDIRAAQAPEITTMTGWLTQWNQPVPDATGSAGSMGGMGGTDSSMPGMMSSQEMTSLQSSSDADFQARWLRLMIAHHAGAVEMAKTEIANGHYQPAIDLASSIVASQSAEIATMKAILG